ncbi:hypothetical protein VVT58_21905 (plasmid) [Sphingobium sp. SJ10-10]|uniref:hypothetical protein n=1 Tax=unclassified Sphingobium TaxID=2611147 RepID=UPI00146EA545|nr:MULTISPECIES: hypothetical protein [unclassified Sphingobium]MEC6699486.1 hypothetical protein [Sphingobium sp. SJ10-10]NML91340.1 hypothetical protein [Sphingobium sp. TB-6]
MAMKKGHHIVRIQTGKDENVRSPHVNWMVAIVGAIVSIRVMLWLVEEARVIDKNDDAVAMLLASVAALFSIGWLAPKR